jgi:hypothetical protein
LADTCKGRSAIAAQLWLGSLSQSKSDPESAAADTDPEILWKIPSLPPLPDLANQDKYLLYAVLLHGSISLPHLSLSLGSSVSATQSHVQSLLRAGLLELDQEILSVSPFHYLKLRSLLAGDNFLLGET